VVTPKKNYNSFQPLISKNKSLSIFKMKVNNSFWTYCNIHFKIGFTSYMVQSVVKKQNKKKTRQLFATKQNLTMSTFGSKTNFNNRFEPFFVFLFSENKKKQ